MAATSFCCIARVRSCHRFVPGAVASTVSIASGLRRWQQRTPSSARSPMVGISPTADVSGSARTPPGDAVFDRGEAVVVALPPALASSLGEAPFPTPPHMLMPLTQ